MRAEDDLGSEIERLQGGPGGFANELTRVTTTRRVKLCVWEREVDENDEHEQEQGAGNSTGKIGSR